MKDRVSSGFIAGFIAGLAMNIPDWIGYLLGLHERRLLDWAAVAIYGALPSNTFQVIFSQAGQLFFAGILGALFSSLILKWASNNLLFKGVLYSIFAWFTLYALPVVFDISPLQIAETSLATAHLISAIVYGVALCILLNKIDKLTMTE